ncbi:hypothetical protein SIN07_05785 [Pediococcus inopinatus]|uniref:hypothetical protein n=1 Tax=Pediococcus inopinatus TaxID=114090 RepID=UPI002A69CB5F|nr:hypothetical protein [Pediococcus inopinatus]WPP08555.1 hypothetical protein SIN07_05785 [Pediococcus inopinatus]
MDYQSLIFSIILSGALGFFNYNLLINQGTFSSYSSKEDRASWCVAFSIINYLIFIRTNIFKLSSNSDLQLFYVVSITFLISLVLTIIVIPLVAKLFSGIINLFRNGKSLPKIAKATPRELAFEHNGYIHAFIFNFDHEFITEGYIKHFSESIDIEHQLLIEPQRDMELSDLKEDDVIKTMNEEYLKPDNGVTDTKIYLDTKSSLKYYLIYY